jgi:hypothetical protein
MIKLFVRSTTPLGDVLEFLASTNRPIRRLTTYTDGWDIELDIAPVEQARLLPKATAHGLVVGGRQHTKPVEPVENVGVFGEYSLEELMGQPVKAIDTFLAAHEDELGLKDYQDMLEWEQTHKKRSTVVKGLRVLTGGGEGRRHDCMLPPFFCWLSSVMVFKSNPLAY